MKSMNSLAKQVFEKRIHDFYAYRDFIVNNALCFSFLVKNESFSFGDDSEFLFCKNDYAFLNRVWG